MSVAISGFVIHSVSIPINLHNTTSCFVCRNILRRYPYIESFAVLGVISDGLFSIGQASENICHSLISMI